MVRTPAIIARRVVGLTVGDTAGNGLGLADGKTVGDDVELALGDSVG